MNLIEAYRSTVMHRTMSVASISQAWPVIISTLRPRIPAAQPPNRQMILDLGDVLSDAFLAVGGDRSQGSLSGAGVVWESLVVWYLNLCLCGTRAVALKGVRPLLPGKIDNAMMVTHQLSRLRTETDVLIIHFDNAHADAACLPRNSRTQFRRIVDQHVQDASIINLQCKTNWNDNAQIPMLWGLVYSPNFTHESVSIGGEGVNLHSLKHFRYAFATVPTQRQLDRFTATSLPVLRVRTLSGGAYWGRPTRNGVCFSLKEIFNRNQQGGVLPPLASIGNAYCDCANGNHDACDWKVYDLLPSNPATP